MKSLSLTVLLCGALFGFCEGVTLLGTEFAVSPTTGTFTGTFGSNGRRASFRSSSVKLPGGGFVTVWDEAWPWEIRGQMFDQAGAMVGPEFIVNTGAGTFVNGVNTLTRFADVAALGNGAVVVTWSTLRSPVPQAKWDVFFEVFTPTATGPTGGTGPIAVNTYTSGEQSQSQIATLVSGDFMVTWQSANAAGDFDVYCRKFNANGVAAGAEVAVNTYTTSSQKMPAVSALPDGGFVVVWSSAGQDGSGTGVYGQRFDASAGAVGVEFQVNAVTTGNQETPRVATLSGGGFVVTWTGPDVSNVGVYARMFTVAPGTTPAAAGGEFAVNTYTRFHQHQADVTGLSGGGFVIVWSSLAQEEYVAGVYAQLYHGNGSPDGATFRCNQLVGKTQERPSVADLGNDKFLVAWERRYHQGIRTIRAHRYQQ